MKPNATLLIIIYNDYSIDTMLHIPFKVLKIIPNVSTAYKSQLVVHKRNGSEIQLHPELSLSTIIEDLLMFPEKYQSYKVIDFEKNVIDMLGDDIVENFFHDILTISSQFYEIQKIEIQIENQVANCKKKSIEFEEKLIFKRFLKMMKNFGCQLSIDFKEKIEKFEKDDCLIKKLNEEENNENNVNEINEENQIYNEIDDNDKNNEEKKESEINIEELSKISKVTQMNGLTENIEKNLFHY